MNPASLPRVSTVTPILTVVPDQPLVPLTVVTIPSMTRERKLAAIETGTYWSPEMKGLFSSAQLEDSRQMYRVLVALSQLQFPNPATARERLLRANLVPSSFSDFCALTAAMFNCEEEMRSVACLGIDFPWRDKRMFATTSVNLSKVNDARHLRLFEWGKVDTSRVSPQVLVLCNQTAK